jgi:hypothetical protein
MLACIQNLDIMKKIKLDGLANKLYGKNLALLNDWGKREVMIQFKNGNYGLE